VSHTVTLLGPVRTFEEPGVTLYSVIHPVWVRTLADPFGGDVDAAWLTRALSNTEPDVLAVAMQYVEGAPPLYDASGMRIVGDADYGPVLEDGSRREGADFNDYLGIPWAYPDGLVRQPRAELLGRLDCSGFVQVVYGFRGNLPLALRPDGTGIPRTARDVYAGGAGVVVIPRSGERVTDLRRIRVGDLVLFDGRNDGQLDHVGIFLGVDSGGYHRFISNRKPPNGPTMGDVGVRSILETVNGSGYYALGFRATRRL
jgi:hypothetical protein